jgi:hypothetical protein
MRRRRKLEVRRKKQEIFANPSYTGNFWLLITRTMGLRSFFDRQGDPAECLIPASTDTMQEGRIDDQFPKGIDQCHVKRREAAYAPDIDP